MHPTRNRVLFQVSLPQPTTWLVSPRGWWSCYKWKKQSFQSRPYLKNTDIGWITLVSFVLLDTLNFYSKKTCLPNLLYFKIFIASCWVVISFRTFCSFKTLKKAVRHFKQIARGTTGARLITLASSWRLPPSPFERFVVVQRTFLYQSIIVLNRRSLCWC